MKENNDEKKVVPHVIEKETNNNGKKNWNKPTLEDVSGRVMAQPYIRFT